MHSLTSLFNLTSQRFIRMTNCFMWLFIHNLQSLVQNRLWRLWIKSHMKQFVIRMNRWLVKLNTLVIPSIVVLQLKSHICPMLMCVDFSLLISSLSMYCTRFVWWKRRWKFLITPLNLKHQTSLGPSYFSSLCGSIFTLIAHSTLANSSELPTAPVKWSHTNCNILKCYRR